MLINEKALPKLFTQQMCILQIFCYLDAMTMEVAVAAALSDVWVDLEVVREVLVTTCVFLDSSVHLYNNSFVEFKTIL